jgi:hypothetical protein
MAGSNNTFTYVLLAGAAYIAYNWWKSQPATTTTTTGGGSGTPPVTTPGTQYVPPTTLQQLQTAAGSSTAMLNADQWQVYWNNIGKPAISSDIFTALFFPTGRPSDPAQTPTFSASDFLSALSSKGLSGYRGRGAVYLPVPRVLVRGRGFGGYSLGDFRRAGGRY